MEALVFGVTVALVAITWLLWKVVDTARSKP
jgi:hypothetical protein